MGIVTYRPAEVLHWFEIGSKEALQRAKGKGSSVSGHGILHGIKVVAGVATDLGIGTMTGLAQKKAEDTSFDLSDTYFEVTGLTGRKRISYSEVTEVRSKPHDRAEIVHRSGTLTIKPIAHLVSGRMRVPVGWTRNGMEVPYTVLIEEIAARSGVEVVAE
ncbi:MAG: hypothetical protein JNM34_04010 [Chthonomonadaceae bacterium]|nr:hypothetical protein [Chthonomonadaceae bacterium]